MTEGVFELAVAVVGSCIREAVDEATAPVVAAFLLKVWNNEVSY